MAVGVFAAAPVANGAPGDIIVLDSGAALRGLIRVNPATGARSSLAIQSRHTDPPGLRVGAMAVAPGGDVLVAESRGDSGDGRLVGVDPRNGNVRSLTANGDPARGPDLRTPTAVVAAPTGEIFVADDEPSYRGDPRIIRVDPWTGARAVVAQNILGRPPVLDAPVGLAVAADGAVLVADEGSSNRYGEPQPTGSLLRVNPGTGRVTVVSANDAPSGAPAFARPAGVTVAPDGSEVVADTDAYGGGGGLIRVEPDTGRRTSVTQNSAPTGAPLFVDPFALVLGAGGNVVVADVDAFADHAGGLIQVDPRTGTRSTLSANERPPGGPSFGAPFGVAVERPVDTRPPVIRGLSLRPRRFRAGRRASFRYRLSERARVVFSISRWRVGRRVRGKCRSRTYANATRPRCVRMVPLGRFAQIGHKGRNRKRFFGRINHKRLRPGRYRATLRASDLRRNRSRRRRVGFEVRR